MNTYTILFDPNLCQPARVVEAEELLYDESIKFLKFRTGGEVVALVRLADVLQVHVVRADTSRVRSYDAKKVEVANDDATYGNQRITIFTPVDISSWVNASGLSDLDAVREVAIDAAREFGFETVGAVEKVGLRSDVKSGRTRIQWRAEVAS